MVVAEVAATLSWVKGDMVNSYILDRPTC